MLGLQCGYKSLGKGGGKALDFGSILYLSKRLDSKFLLVAHDAKK